MPLELETGWSGSIAVVVCRGRIVFGNETTELSKTIRALLDKSPRIVLDLAAVQNLDSGGLGTLLGLVASARRNGGDLKLCNLSRKAEEVLRLTKLAEVVQAFPDRQAALDSFPRS